MPQDPASNPPRLAIAPGAEPPAGAQWIAWAQCPKCLKLMRREGIEAHMKDHNQSRPRRPRPPMLLVREPAPRPPAGDTTQLDHGEDDGR